MPDVILKAAVFKRISDASRVAGMSQSPAIAKVIADLGNSKKKLADIAISAGMYQDHTQSAHLEQDWLDLVAGKPGFWHASPYKVEELVRKGLLSALNLFWQTGKPLDLFWAISGPNMTDPWNVAVAECPEHILVIFFTPNVPCPLPTVDDYSILITEQDGAGNVTTRNSKRPAG
jgi:hypothetical protein